MYSVVKANGARGPAENTGRPGCLRDGAGQVWVPPGAHPVPLVSLATNACRTSGTPDLYSPPALQLPTYGMTPG